MAQRPQLEGGDWLAIFGADLIPLPIWRVLALEEQLRAMPHVDRGLIDAAFELLGELAGADPFAAGEDEAHVVAHGDPAPGNWMVRDGRIVALLDFEWSRVGPRDLDLVTPVFVAWAELSDVPFLRWLEEDYPELFGGREWERRLWLYEVCFFLRGIMAWPPVAPEATLEAGHHVHSLRRVLEGPLPR